MTALRFPALVALGCLVLGLAASSGQAPAAKVFLLEVSKGQLPTDTGMDDKTVPETVDSKELGGKAMKVAFAPGDSIGVRPGGTPKNWKQYGVLRMDVFNPAKDPVKLELVVQHARSTSYQTRVAVLLKLKAGKNEVRVGTDEM